MIFDYDGVLVDSAPWVGSVINEVARRYRFKQLEAGEFDTLRNRDVGALLRHLRVSRWKLLFIVRHMRKLATRDRDRISLFPGAGDALRSLHAGGIRLALVSSNTRENIEHALGPDLVSLFDYYACGASLSGKAKKFRRVVGAGRLSAADAIAVGDEVRDIEAAREAGIASAAVAWGYADAAVLAAERPTLAFAHMQDLVARLGGVTD